MSKRGRPGNWYSFYNAGTGRKRRDVRRPRRARRDYDGGIGSSSMYAEPAGPSYTSSARRRTPRNTIYRGLLGMEKKYIDCYWRGLAVPTASESMSDLVLGPSIGCTSAINIPAQGDGASERDGRRFTMTGIYASGMISWSNITGQTGTVNQLSPVYVCLVQAIRNNGTVPDTSDIFENDPSVTFGYETEGYPQALRRLSSVKNYKILASAFCQPRSHYLVKETGANMITAQEQMVPWELSWKGKMVVDCTSSATTASYASCESNAVYLVAFWWQSSTIAGGAAYLYGKSRCRFYG